MKTLSKVGVSLLSCFSLLICACDSGVAPTAVRFNAEEIYLEVDDTYIPSLEFEPEDATKLEGDYTISNEQVIAINPNIRTLEALALGDSVLTWTSKYNQEVTASMTVHVIKKIQQILDLPDSMSVAVTGTETMEEYTIAPADGDLSYLSVVVEPSNIARMVDNYTVEGLEEGEGFITFKYAGGEILGKIPLTVTPAILPTSIRFRNPTTNGTVGTAVTYEAYVTMPGNATNKKITYTSGDESIVKIDSETGQAVLLKEGKTNIKATSVANPSVSYNTSVTVTAAASVGKYMLYSTTLNSSFDFDATYVLAGDHTYDKDNYYYMGTEWDQGGLGPIQQKKSIRTLPLNTKVAKLTFNQIPEGQPHEGEYEIIVNGNTYLYYSNSANTQHYLSTTSFNSFHPSFKFGQVDGAYYWDFVASSKHIANNGSGVYAESNRTDIAYNHQFGFDEDNYAYHTYDNGMDSYEPPIYFKLVLVKYESINISADTTTINPYEYANITVGGSPSDATGDVIFTSSNPSVCLVNASGRITGLSAGTSVITATTIAENGDVLTSNEITITVANS